MKDISLIIPAHDEQESLAPLVHETRRCYERLGIDGEIVIVDDGSTDKTSKIVEKLCGEGPDVKSIRFPEKTGKTNALRAGFHLASGRVIAIVDADLQYDLAELPLLYNPILSGRYDLVNGYRIRRQDSIIRRAPSLIYNRLNRWVFHVNTRDANSGFKAMKSEAFASIEPFLRKDYHRYLVSVGGYLGYRILEVPITHFPRSTGRSKYSCPTRIITGFLDMLRVRWLLRGCRSSVTKS